MSSAEDASQIVESPPTADYELDHAVCDLLVAMESYQLEREVISRSLSKAFFSIAKARRSQAFLAHPEDIRAELRSNLRIRVGVELASSPSDVEDGESESECVCFSAEERESESGAAMLMLCALPPPALKHAKSEFRGAVDEVCALARAAQAVQRARERLEVARGLRTRDDCPFRRAALLVREGLSSHTAGEAHEGEGEGEKEIAEEREQDWTEIAETETEGLIPDDNDEPVTSNRPLRASLQGQREKQRERQREEELQRLSSRVPMCADLDSSSDDEDSD